MSRRAWRRHVAALMLLSGLPGCTEPAAPASLTAIAVSRGADWFAYRNEGGEWTPIAESPGGVYTFLATPRVAIAYAVSRAGVAPSLSIEYRTAESYLDEAATLPAPAEEPTGTASGVARGIPMVASYAWIGHGPRSDHVFLAKAVDSAFALPTWARPMDLVAILISLADSTREIAAGTRAVLRRGQRLSPGSAIAVDFAAPDAFPLGSATLSWTGPELGVEVEFISATGSRAMLSRVQNSNADKALIARTRTITRMPPDRMLPGDLHRVSFGDATRSTTRWTHTPSDAVLDLGPLPSAPTVTLASSGASGRPQFVVPAHAEFGDDVHASAEQRGIVPGSPYLGTLHRISVQLSKGYLGGTPRASWTLEVPDLTSLAGFPTSVLLAPGGYSWTVAAHGANCARCADSVFDGRIDRRWVVGDTVR